MTKLAVLEEPRIFPPKKILLIIWGWTLAIALFGLFATPLSGGAIYIWLGILLISLWQLWTFRWVQVDSDGIRARNLLQRGRELKWEEITEYREEEVRLSKHPYIVLHLSNQAVAPARPVKIKLTNDQIGFESLRTIVREAVPKG